MKSSRQISDLSREASEIRSLTTEQKERLTEILDQYLSELEQGVPGNPQSLLDAHPDLAEPLRIYFASLNELHGISGGFRGESAEPEDTSVVDGDQKRLGDFLLGREVGRGGMGVVYEARQISLARRVALKVLPFAAVLDSKQIARFKNEAQAAAQLHHPHIVPVFAVGAERGVHYYAMQFIEGQPLDRVIRELRAAASLEDEGEHDDDVSAAADEPFTDGADESTCRSFVTSRSQDRGSFYRTVVRLGMHAAEALHAAHEYGVVHRDVKPSNLMLDHHGKIWVTDFGLARCLHGATLTRTGDVVGTMRYMSPEQARGDTARIDQRTDVYSLAATLYELLTLHPAVPGDDRLAMLRFVEHEEVPRPRRWSPDLPVEIETVILKGMARDREDRYPTAASFAEDLRRVLEGRPTVARPQTLSDRVTRWARRHRRLVGATTAVALLAVFGFGLSTVLIAREKLNTERNYRRAERHLRSAQEAVDRFGAQVAERLAYLPGADQVRRDLLQDTLRYYQEFIVEAAADPALQSDLALTHSKMGTLADEMGSTAESLAAHRKSLALFTTLVAAEPENDEYRRRLAICKNNFARTLRRSGQISEAREEYRDAIQIQLDLTRRVPSAELTGDLALSFTNLGLLQSETNDFRSAGESLRRAIELQEQLLAANRADPDLLRKAAATYNNLSAIYLATDLAAAEECYRTAIVYQQQAAASGPWELRLNSDLGLTYSNLGSVQSRRENFAEASSSYEQAIAIQQRLVAAAPEQKLFRRDLAVSFNNRGLMQSRLGLPREAKESFLQALSLQSELVSQHADDVQFQSSLGGVYNNLGIVSEELGDLQEAATAYRNAIDCQRRAFEQAASVSRYRVFLSKHYYNYGRVLRLLGSGQLAAQAALARRELWPDDPHKLLEVAEDLARAAAVIEPSPGANGYSSPCSTWALETLQRAVALGLKLPPNLAESEAFAAFQHHEAFSRLVGLHSAPAKP